MQLDSALNAERPVAALIGNGELVTTVGRSGYHDEQEHEPRVCAAQEFVMAGRRLPGARHELIPFGMLIRRLFVNGIPPELVESQQSIQTDVAEIRTRNLYADVLESTRCAIFGHRNCFVAETRISNHSSEDINCEWEIDYVLAPRTGKPMAAFEYSVSCAARCTQIDWQAGDNLGVISLMSDAGNWEEDKDCLAAKTGKALSPGEEMVIRTILSFSDRINYQEPVRFENLESEVHRHAEWWREFWAKSEVITGDELVDNFRISSLYTLACQCTPWSIPPTVSKPYWDAGAFHDEYYPFIGLISGGRNERSRRVPYYRLTTLTEAMKRARGEGALYPWSATEDGYERDPHGHWYTERFHLGQIGACVWSHWLYERRSDAMEDLYPVLRECARYFERQMMQRDERGTLRTKPCTDFDESVGMIPGGPFTMAAAVYLFDHASEAARRLNRDRERSLIYDRLAKELRQNFAVDLEHHRYAVPGGHSQHVSILGYVVPFMLDDKSEFARNSLSFVQERFRTELGWKPGLSKAFLGTTWMWTAGHLGMCQAVAENGEAAWEAVRRGPLSAGQFLSPNEHLNPAGEPIVPWFTTGCGAWLAALHWMFARVDDDGDHILPAVAETLATFQVRGLRLSRGVSISVKSEEGKLVYLSLTSPAEMAFSFEIPVRFVDGIWPKTQGRIVDLGDAWRIQVELIAGENVFI